MPTVPTVRCLLLYYRAVSSALACTAVRAHMICCTVIACSTNTVCTNFARLVYRAIGIHGDMIHAVQAQHMLDIVTTYSYCLHATLNLIVLLII